MELSPPLRWLAAIGVMLVVVLIAVPLLLNTVSSTVQLSSGAATEEALSDPAELASDDPTSVPDGDGEDDNGDEDNGDDGDDDGDDGDDEFPQEYTVEAGDTGAEISERFYGDQEGWAAIAEANDIDPGAPLRVGEELEIPAPE